MNSRTLAIMVVSLAVVGACHVGPQVSEIAALRVPHGATVEIVVKEKGSRRKSRYEGELIEVSDAGLLLELEREDGRHLVLAHWRELDKLQATELDGFLMRSSDSPERREELMAEYRLISRFPQGLSDELRSRLLAAYNQDAPRELASLRD